MKNSDLGDGVKADHLTYIGDADVGAGASFGCGSITVNYDWDASTAPRSARAPASAATRTWSRR